jgi:lipopolysaccharide heptosyltransferase II
MSGNAWSSARNVLCVRLDNLGDVLMTTPALRALRQSLPGRRIVLLASKSGAQAAAHVDEVDDVIVYDAPWMKATPSRSNLPDVAMIRTLAARGFDAAVIFTVYTQSALPGAFLCWMAGIPLRLAYCRENPYHLLTDWAAETEPHHGIRHEVQRQLDLVASVGCTTDDARLSFRVSEDARQHAMHKLAQTGLDVRRPWLVIHPGATAPSRRYPPALFAAVARQLHLRHGWQIVFTGTAGERELIGRIAAEMQVPAHSVAGALSVDELAAVLGLASVLVGNNSGPAHIAAAVNTPVVDLYALTNPQHTPWMVPARVLNHDVPCKYCYKSICPMQHHHCLTLVEPARVVAAVQELAGARAMAPAGARRSLPLMSALLRGRDDNDSAHVHTRN